MNGDLHVVDDLPGIFSDTVIRAFQRRQDDEFCMALSGGSTARHCYERLAETGAELIDWWAVNVFWSHERCVAADDPESNQLLVRQSLLERVGAANAVYPMRCDEGPGPYQLRLGEIGKLDLVHLTLGPDGHTASLFAGSTALDADPGQWVTLSADPTGRFPDSWMTLTLSGISRARLVVFTAAGEPCRDALQAIVDGADLPAARVSADEVVWLVDRKIAPRH
ncbi:MAG TPA: 6-phosphogluconolactonase [Acidimicrobiales bacterium]